MEKQYGFDLRQEPFRNVIFLHVFPDVDFTAREKYLFSTKLNHIHARVARSVINNNCTYTKATEKDRL